MAKDKERARVDVGAERHSLTNSPFAALASLAGDPVPAEKTSKSEAPTASGKPYRIARTRKGGWPIRVERRPGGKVATVISNVSGDADALLRELKRTCGAGGVAREGTVELQGDHAARLEAILSSI